MRKITTHKEGDYPQDLFAEETLGPGGAPHFYGWKNQPIVDNGATAPALAWLMQDPMTQGGILFQYGGVPENGTNGVTIELLLAICADRLRCFQAGPFSSPFNEQALAMILMALETLHDRTAERQARGVEGRHTP